MPLHKTYINKNFGFTLVEILIVIALFTMIAVLIPMIDPAVYTRQLLHNEQKELITTLYHARSQAMNTICLSIICTGNLSYGLHIEHNQYTLFQGIVYDPLDQNNQITLLDNNTHAYGISDVVFIEFSGDTYTSPATSSTIMLLTSDGKISTTSIGRDGQINWTQ